MIRFRSRGMLAAVCVVALAAGACGKELFVPPPADTSTPLFEVESQNTAWFPYWAGYYVDGEGHVYRWNRTDQLDPALQGDVLTPAQLSAKYAPGRELAKTLAAGEALRRYELVGAAASGGLADEKHACADAGIQTFSAWVLRGDGNYHRILLHQRGDLATTRRTEEARTLWHWLEEVTGQGAGATGCDPYP